MTALAAPLSVASAADVHWGSSSGSWNNPGNWFEGSPPGPGDAGIIDYNPNPTTFGLARVTTNVGTVGRVDVTRANTLSVERRGVLTTLGDVNLGVAHGGFLSVSSDLPTILDPATLNVGRDLRLGVQDGDGRVDQTSDFVNVTGNLALGYSNIVNSPGQPSGRYNLIGGRLNVGGTVYVAHDATGSTGDMYIHHPAYAQVNGIAGNGTGFIKQFGGEVHVGQGGIVFPSSPKLLDYTLSGGVLTSARTVVNSGGVIYYHDGFLSAGRLNVNGGRVIIAEPGDQMIQAIEVTVTDSPGGLPGFIDLNEGGLAVSYSSSPIDSIRALIRRGFRNGLWTSGGGAFAYQGITSSAAGRAVTTSQKMALGYFDHLEDVGLAGGSTVVVKYTLMGDANVDGTVNLQDFNRLAANFGRTNRYWQHADFNYDGTVNLADFNLLAANFGVSAAAGASVLPQDWATLAAAVPEPATWLNGFGIAAWSAACPRRPRRPRR